MSLRHHLRVLRRGWPLLLVLAVAGGALGWVSGGDAEPAVRARYYRAVVTLTAARGSDASTSPGAVVQRAAVTAVIGAVAERAAQDVDETPEEFLSHINVSADTTLDLLQIVSVGTDDGSTVARARALAEQLLRQRGDLATLIQQRARDRALGDLDDLRGRIDELDRRLALGDSEVVRAERDALINQYRLAYESLQQVAAAGPAQADLARLDSSETPEAVEISRRDYAAVVENGPLTLPQGNRPTSGTQLVAPTPTAGPATPVSSSDGRQLRAAMGAALGLLLGAGILLARAQFDTRLRTSEDAEAAFRLPVLAEVPAAGRNKGRRRAPVTFTNPLSQSAEGYRRVRAALLHLATSRNEHDRRDPAPSLVVLVTSSEPGEDAAVAVANLAAALAEGELEVLVLGDFRRPRAAALLGVDVASARGIDGSHEYDVGALALPTSVPGVSFIPGTSASHTVSNPAQLLDTERSLIDRARDCFDVIILETSPILVTSDAVDLLAAADLVLLAALVGRTTRRAADSASELLERFQAPVAGVVLMGSSTAKVGRELFQPSLRREAEEVDGRRRAAPAYAAKGRRRPASGRAV